MRSAIAAQLFKIYIDAIQSQADCRIRHILHQGLSRRGG